MRKVMVSLLLGIFLISFAFAISGEGNNDNIATLSRNLSTERQALLEQRQELMQQRQELGEQLGENLRERLDLREQMMDNIRERMEENDEMTMFQKGSLRTLVLRKINSEEMELQDGEARIRTELMLNNENNASELRARLSNGRNAEIKIMPDRASETALMRLRLKVCNETRNCTIELKEVGEGNKTRLIYEAKARKTFRLFGIFKNKEDVSFQMDAETGEEISSRRPWWAWMASEEDEAEEIVE